ADGGTRCAAITGAWVALREAIDRQLAGGLLTQDPIRGHVAAVSVGISRENAPILDLDYVEDSSAIADMNVVMDSNANLIEVQATGEQSPSSRAELNALRDLAGNGIETLVNLQRQTIESIHL